MRLYFTVADSHLTWCPVSHTCTALTFLWSFFFTAAPCSFSHFFIVLPASPMCTWSHSLQGTSCWSEYETTHYPFLSASILLSNQATLNQPLAQPSKPQNNPHSSRKVKLQTIKNLSSGQDRILLQEIRLHKMVRQSSDDFPHVLGTCLWNLKFKLKSTTFTE